MNYRTILTVVNEQSASTVTACYAIAMAQAAKARLVFYSADPAGTGEKALHQIDRHLDHLFTTAFDLGVNVTRITEVGTITHLLLQRILTEKVDLVFYPLHPAEPYGDTLQRYNVHRFLRTIRTDLAIMRIMHMGKPHPRHILVPLAANVSDREQKTAFLAALTRSFHAKITLFHRTAGRSDETPVDFIAMRDALLQQQLPVLERSGSGGIAKAIALEAISHHNDLIVIGASERGMLRRMFFGNPAGDLMHYPPCNVILFRAALTLP